MHFSSLTILTLLSALAAAKPGKVVLYDTAGCEGKELWTGEVDHDPISPSNDEINAARSFKYEGYFSLLVAKNHLLNDHTCGYCSNYHEDHSGGGCQDINTGWPLNEGRIVPETNDPSDIPCRNYLINCPFPVPPGNGLEDQGE